MLHSLSKFLMNAQANGGSPGGAPPPAGTPPAGTTPADPQAQAGQAQPGMSLAELRAELKTFRDSVFADTRKMVEGITDRARGQAGATPPAGAAAGAQGQPPAPMAPADVQQIIARHSAFTRAVTGVTLSDGQLSRMEKAFQLEAPEDVTAWAKSYLADFGLDKTSGAAGAAGQTTTTQQTQSRTPPASDAGGAAAPPPNLEGVSLLKMSEADRAHLIREKGLDWYRKTLIEQSRGVTVKLG